MHLELDFLFGTECTDFFYLFSRRRQKSMTPHTPSIPPYHETVTIDSDNEQVYDRVRRDYWMDHRAQSPIMVISGMLKIFRPFHFFLFYDQILKQNLNPSLHG